MGFIHLSAVPWARAHYSLILTLPALYLGALGGASQYTPDRV